MTQFSMRQTLQGGGSELFELPGGGAELKSNFGSLNAWTRTVARLLEIDVLAWFVPAFETADGYSQLDC